MGKVTNGCGQSGHETLQLTVSQESIDEWTDFLYTGAKAKSYFTDFLVWTVKNEYGHLVP